MLNFYMQIFLKTPLSVVLPLEYIGHDITEQCYAIKNNDNVMATAQWYAELVWADPISYILGPELYFFLKNWC